MNLTLNGMNLRNSIILGALLGLSQFVISDSYAYIDPGSGSLVLQMIVGALVGVGIAIKVYWYKFKEKILSKVRKDE